MKQKVTSFLILILLSWLPDSTIAQLTLPFGWARPINGTADDNVTDIVAGKGDHLYACGYFSSATIQLGSQSLTSSGAKDIFVVKYDTAGNLLWARRMGGTGDDEAVAIAADSLDNIYITGSCSGNTVFGPFNFTGSRFIAKLGANGDVQWVTEPATNITIKDIAADPAGNTVICGSFVGTCTIGGTTVAANENEDGFVARYNTVGNIIWFKHLYGLKPSFNNQYSVVRESCESVAIAPNGHIALGGYTNGGEKLVILSGATIDITFTTSQVWDSQQRYGYVGLVMQWDASGNLLWLKDNLNNINSGRYWSVAQNLATNANADVYVAAETMAKSNGAGMYTPRLFKYNTTGVQLWAYTLPTYYPGTFVGYPATNPRVAFAQGRAYLSEKDVLLIQSGLPNAQHTRIHCFDDFGIRQWTTVNTGNTAAIYALAAKQTAYASGIIGSGSFGNLPINYTSGTDGYVAKVQYQPSVNQPLAFADTAIDQAICIGGGVVLAPNLLVSGGVQPYTYSWTPAATLSNAAQPNPTAMPIVTTQYILTVTDAQGNTLKDSLLVSVLPPLPPPTIQLLVGPAGSLYDTLLCVSPLTGLGYEWRNIAGSAILSSTDRMLVLKGFQARFQVTIKNGLNGCNATSDLFYYNIVKANAGRDTTICSGQAITLGGIPPYLGMPGGTVRYSWFSTATGPIVSLSTNPYVTIAPTATADYFLQIDEGSGNAEIADTLRITIKPKPNLGLDTLIYHQCYLETTNLLPLYNTTGLTAAWNTTAPTLAPPGSYRLIATNAVGCADTVAVTIQLQVATWMGTVSSDWHTAANWSNHQVPNPLTHVIINNGTPNNCVVGTAPAVAASVQLRNGAVLTAANGMTITITGNCAVLPPG